MLGSAPPVCKSACLQFAVDAGCRMVEPLPKSFAGNAYVLASVILTAETLEETTYDELARKVTETKESATDNYVEAYIEPLERSEATTLPALEELTIISDWARMPFHSPEFMGRRVTHRSLTSCRTQTIAGP
ncbi:hypothetical protein MLD38_007107 [Melastoma candidum]|uniref:Uncharacterized protein n=1 Tax=Melastoma candidum TaxID=119954 RepID=A0ACB9RRB1_9MYRT|nr:hypothetical protein MLD38_007107 [Melastoma candidum]